MPRESKRKPRVPQQATGAAGQVAPMAGSPQHEGCQELKEQLCFLAQQLRRLQEKFSQVCDSGDTAQTQESAEKVHPLPEKPGDGPDEGSATATSDARKAPLWKSVLEVRGLEEEEDSGDTGGLPSAARVLSQALKHELAGVTSQVVDSVLKTRGPLEPLDLHWGTVKLRSSVVRQQQQHPLPLSPADMESLARLPAGRDGCGELQAAMDGVPFASTHMQEALTPGHLKKAKLMFFFTRYPSSTLLKTYFLDVQFSRCITSQLIKWLSNFREFYYIQVEKFARQALVEGVVDAGTLRVSRDSELFRALNMHYNKGNDFEVPGRFLEVASLTLREFFSAIRAGKDADPSWKKPIYKIISKLDSNIPEGFKAAACSQELLRS
nr:PREDICTED: prospero homeobox protein 1-like [Haliaeetus albicilla]